MIIVSLPIGSTHGWGVCGKYLTRELSRLTGGQTRLLSEAFTAESVGDELEFNAIAATLMNATEAAGTPILNGVRNFPHPLLTCIGTKQMNPWQPTIRGRPTLGYTFFEENILQPEWIEAGRRNFDIVATGSTWNAEVLKQYGMTNVHPALQGIDPLIFFPREPGGGSEREFLTDRFVIFSGGKFEFRKGQDIVIRAVKVMQERHRDVVLINSWFNAWQSSFDSMRVSPYLAWPNASGAYPEIMARLLTHNGLDLSRVIILGPRNNSLMARIYRNSDVGLFPNRCEGGTNLVMMEYMACGRPVVATATTGHSDIVRAENAFIINATSETVYNGPAGPVARWPEPNLDDTIDKLEEAYQNRAALRAKGEQAGKDLKRFTWGHAAEVFLQLLTGRQSS